MFNARVVFYDGIWTPNKETIICGVIEKDILYLSDEL